MKKFFFYRVIPYIVCVIAVTGFAGCSDSDSGDGDNVSDKTLKLQKMHLDGAKYLSLTGNGTRATGNDEIGLFKIDEEGNMTTVVLSCTEEENGTVKRTRTDIKVTPRYIYPLSGIYTFMEDCRFTDGEGNSIYMGQYYEPDAIQFNILVRNSDGAIFYIPKSLSDTYFLRANSQHLANTTTDNNGNLYLFAHDTNNLGMVTIQNGKLVLKQVNPNNVGIDFGDDILPFDNGTIMTYRADNNFLTCTFFYPNGGFEEYCGYKVIETFADGGYSDEAILPVSKVKSGTKAVVVKGISREGLAKEYIVSLCDFHVGTSYGDHSLSEPIASLSSGTDYSTYDPQAPDYLDWVAKYQANSSIWFNGIYETTNMFIIGTTLVVDKRTMEMRPLNSTESNIIFPNANNTYKGLAWNVGCWGAEWYNIETMQYGKVDFNLPSDFRINNETADIPSGKLVVTGTRYTDGKSVTYFVDIETGNYVCTESDSERPITALIPLN